MAGEGEVGMKVSGTRKIIFFFFLRDAFQVSKESQALGSGAECLHWQGTRWRKEAQGQSRPLGWVMACIGWGGRG